MQMVPTELSLSISWSGHVTIYSGTSNDANEPTPTSSRPTVAPVLEEEEPQESGAKSHTINGQAHPGVTFAPEASAVEGNVANSSGKDPLDPLSWYSKLWYSEQDTLTKIHIPSNL